jgi:hypothetical protein
MTYSSCVDLPKLTWSLRKNFKNKRNRRTSYKEGKVRQKNYIT